ncbi:MAG: asparagine synthase (glutamine-hydrolyzing) [Syntrophobacteraceae bacterium]
MCGICGRIDPSGVRIEEIERMSSVLAHRGPDGEGAYVNGRVGFGHRRLAIIDLEGGRQPMANEDETVWITFNGEIYNFRELGKNLAQKHRFRTRSDTETIVHLYEEMGTGCLKHLRGMFAFAIYDHREKLLFIARDHLGQKPLYYYHNGPVFAFASEIKSLLAGYPELRELDCEALYEYLTIRIITPPRSMFKNIRKLPPGHYLIYRDGRVFLERYWALNYEPKLSEGFDDVVDALENQVRESVRVHMVSDVPVGAFLSGGMDSSLVVAMMAGTTDLPVKTFSGDVPYRSYSELPFARMVSDRYRTEHNELTITPSLVRTLPDLVWHLDEPSDLLSVCMYYISEFAGRQVKVVLGGDGGDELFGGYDRYYGNVLVSYYVLLPDAVRRCLIGRVLRLLPEGFWYRSLSHRLRWMNEMSFYSESERYAKSLGYFYFSDGFKERLYTKSFRSAVATFDPEATIREYFDSGNATEAIDRMLFSDSMVRMPDHPNMVLDRMTMAHGLEARAPFLDHKLAEFCASIPSKFKVKGTKRRIIQKALARRHLPTALTDKKKQGFSSALTYMLEDEFRHIYDAFLHKCHLSESGYINQETVDTLLNEHLTKRADHGNRLWLICSAEIWYRMYMENESIDEIRNLLSS